MIVRIKVPEVVDPRFGFAFTRSLSDNIARFRKRLLENWPLAEDAVDEFLLRYAEAGLNIIKQQRNLWRTAAPWMIPINDCLSSDVARERFPVMNIAFWVWRDIKGGRYVWDPSRDEIIFGAPLLFLAPYELFVARHKEATERRN